MNKIMIQVWNIDVDGIFTESTLIEEEYFDKNTMVKTPIGNVGFYKAKWNGEKWIEGATEEEIKAWQEENKVVRNLTREETLSKELAVIKINDMKKDKTISSLSKTVAELKLQIMNMKEGK